MQSLALGCFTGMLFLEMYKIRYILTVKYFMKYFGNISVFNQIFQNATSLCSTSFFLPQRCHGTYLVMLNTYNYVVLGWNTSSTSFFTLKTILLWLGLGFGPVDKHIADITQKHVANIAQKREGLL